MSGYNRLIFSGSDPKLSPYHHMIYSDFLKSLRWGNSWFKLIDQATYFSKYEYVINQLLLRPKTIIRLAVLDEDNDICLGWSMTEGDILHYVFVKKDQRKQGIARALIPQAIGEITHLTKIGEAIWKAKLPEATFNPFA